MYHNTVIHFEDKISGDDDSYMYLNVIVHKHLTIITARDHQLNQQVRYLVLALEFTITIVLDFGRSSISGSIQSIKMYSWA
jgi:hypothetical protein